MPLSGLLGTIFAFSISIVPSVSPASAQPDELIERLVLVLQPALVIDEMLVTVFLVEQNDPSESGDYRDLLLNEPGREFAALGRMLKSPLPGLNRRRKLE